MPKARAAPTNAIFDVPCTERNTAATLGASAISSQILCRGEEANRSTNSTAGQNSTVSMLMLLFMR